MEIKNQFPADLEALLEETAAALGDGVITDRNLAYAVSVAYDRIRDTLMESQSLWQTWQHIYWQRKYCSCSDVLARLDNSLKQEYQLRMAREFRRAMDQGELCQSDFEAGQWKKIRMMIDEEQGLTGTRGALRKAARRLPGWARRPLVAVLRQIKKQKD